MRRISLAIVALLLMVIPSAAHAQGNSAVDEYTEGIPGGGGENPSSEAGQPTGGAPLPSDVVSEFDSAGAEGAAAAELAQSTGGGPDRDAGAREDQPRSGDRDGGLGAAVTEVLDSDSDSGMGIALPIILGAALVAAIIFGIARTRGSGTPA